MLDVLSEKLTLKLYTRSGFVKLISDNITSDFVLHPDDVLYGFFLNHQRIFCN